MSAPLPPGQSGWPVLGEALGFAANPYAFIADRVANHGPVVRSRILAQDLAILAGPTAAAAFLDEENVRRKGGLPPHAAALFGDGVVNQLDGEAHRRRKRHLMNALDHHALAHYLPASRELLRTRLAAWRAAGEVGFEAEANRASLALNLSNFLGIAATDDELAAGVKGYSDFGKALVGLPIAFPGSALARARKFNAEMHARFEATVAARRATPTGDGASRMVASEVEGERLSDREIALELQHALFASSGLPAWFALAVRTLSEQPALDDALRAEVSGLPADPSGRQYAEADLLNRFILELKRTGLVIPITAFGVARRDFEVEGHTVPKGWLVVWATCASHTDPKVAPYTSAGTFDPERYAAPREEHRPLHHFAPQGPGEALTSHRCAGVEYSTFILQIFLVELLRGPKFTLPPQDLSLDTSELPARHKGGLRVRFEA